MSRATIHFKRLGLTLIAISLALAIGLSADAAGRTPAAIAQGFPTATATSSVLQLPTATATILGGPTATPSRTPSVAPVIAQALGDINLRSGPGTNTDVVGQLKTGDTVPVIGRSLQYPWFVVAWKDAPNGQAWVYSGVVTIIGDPSTIPIIEPPPPPTLDPAQESAGQTATVVFATPGAADTATANFLAQPVGAFTITPQGGAAIAAIAPTFTQPADLPNNRAIPTGAPTSQNKSGIPPAVVIIGLGAMGVLFLGLGLVRRMF